MITLFGSEWFPIPGGREILDKALKNGKDFVCAGSKWPRTALVPCEVALNFYPA